jgi:guanylate kinase
MSSEAAAGPPGQLLVLSAPSGAGKTTLARRFVAQRADAVFSVSATTRAPRGAEQDGVDYHFIDGPRFAELAAGGAFAEWAEVHGQRYGTLRSTVEASLAAGQVALFDIDVQGGEQIKAAFPRQATTILVLPPSLAELERRLRSRSTDAEAVIARRLAAARDEVARGLLSYQYVVVNDELEQALARLVAVAASERARLAGQQAPAGAAELAESCRRERVALPTWAGHAGA